MTDRMINNLCEQGYHLIDHFLPDQQMIALRNLILTLQEQDRLQPAQIGRLANKQQEIRIRNDHICWLDHAAEELAVQNYLATIEILRQQLNQALYLSLIEFEAHFAVYSPGNFYKKHVDQFQTTQARKISCVYYLNEAWTEEDGGLLTLYSHDDHLLQQIMPIANRFVCFMSELPHEVSAANRVRYSITGWLKQRDVV